MKTPLGFSIILALLLLSAPVVWAQEPTAKVGVHILQTEEMAQAVQLLNPSRSPDEWLFVTIPFSLEDTTQTGRWQSFFDAARAQRVIPIVRLVTKAENGTWEIPTQKNMVDQLNALQQLNWPTAEKRVILFNEVNHGKEWGGRIDPAGYAKLFRFGAQWAHALSPQFVVLPAAMDLAAPNGGVTRDAFRFLDEMYAFDNEIFSYADAWNSHSYPNPGFSAPPQRYGRNSLYGYQFELVYLQTKGVKDLLVYITETGWEQNHQTSNKLSAYYQYALDKIWQPDARVVAVTPFVLQGAPGPFANFSFLTANGKPTLHYSALQKVLGVSTER